MAGIIPLFSRRDSSGPESLTKPHSRELLRSIARINRRCGKTLITYGVLRTRIRALDILAVVDFIERRYHLQGFLMPRLALLAVHRPPLPFG